MSELEEVLRNYDTSFVEDYDKWRTLVSEINTFIPVYLESISMNGFQVDGFEYNEFCSAYKEEVKKILLENEPLSRESVHYILDLLVQKKVLFSIIK